jgi:hypothetical protein
MMNTLALIHLFGSSILFLIGLFIIMLSISNPVTRLLLILNLVCISLLLGTYAYVIVYYSINDTLNILIR